MSKVNLDALIPREDFVSPGEASEKKSNITSLNLGHLLPHSQSLTSFYDLLKKPDFQRETNEWDKYRITDLIESFINRAFIPSVILWENNQSGRIYVIDGAHRLSAIIAYIHDDYGDRAITQKFNQYTPIPDAEVQLAKETREYINNRLGSFERRMAENGDISYGLKKGAFDVQMITGDVKKAEDSFFKINQQGVVLSPTEKELCKSREKPSCIATRSIMKGGAGTQYWINFKPENQENIKIVSDELNGYLFKPPYNESSASIVLHHPLGGNITTATPMVFEMMKIIKEHYKSLSSEKEDKTNGAETLDYLIKARKIIWQLLSNQHGSLGLFPTVYFYNGAGKHIQSAFLGMVQLLVENEQFSDTYLPKFISARKALEDFLIEYKMFITQINRKYGSKEKSYRHMKGFYKYLIELFSENLSLDVVLVKIKESYPYLNENENDYEKTKKKNMFSTEQKINIGNKEELLHTPRCKICGGLLHPLSKSFDHHIDVKYEGNSNSSNAKTTHHYCNNSKDKLIALGIYKPVY